MSEVVPHTAFVSHAHADNALCSPYVTALRTRGYDLWFDLSNIQNGHFLTQEIQRQLEQRTAFILMLTPSALKSFWVELEINTFFGLMAQDRSRVFLPVRLAECEIPAMMNALTWIDGTRVPLAQTVEAIAQVLSHRTLSTETQTAALVTPSVYRLPGEPSSTPQRLVDLGFNARLADGVEVIIPPTKPIPAGPFIMGSDPAIDSQATSQELPQFMASVGAFEIATFPVTVAEYACAVRAKAARQPYSWQTQLMHYDRPVAFVRWEDIVAYSQWLARTSGQPWRLPTEAEWEKAARGTDGRIYPWGNIWDPIRANTVEAGIGSMTPVGSYPSGVSPYGAQDMLGNVWEWTTTLWKYQYPYRPDDGREDMESQDVRVLRGGSWDFGDAARARIAYRIMSVYHEAKDEDSYLYDVGFRLMRDLPHV